MISSISSSSYYSSAITSTTSTTSSSAASAFQEVMASATNSTDSYSISAQARASQGPPDFDSMSTDDFRSHLEQIQSELVADGVDVSGFPDYANMTDDELDAMKSEMASAGPPPPPQGSGKPQGPPPPPPSSSSYSIEETDESDELLAELLALLEEDEDATYSGSTDVESLVNSAAFQQLVSQYSIS